MTHREVRVEDDGTRVYADYHRYTPVPVEERRYAVRRPADDRAVRFGGDWYLPLDLRPDQERVRPETREDAETLSHRASCRCAVCLRPQAQVLWKRARR